MKRTLTEKYSFASRFVLCLTIMASLPSLVQAATHPLFNLQSTIQSPFPSDRFAVPDQEQRTGLRVNLPLPNCGTNPSDCADITLLNQLDGFNLQPRLSVPFDGGIDVSTVNSNTVFLVRLREHGSAPQVIGINQVVWDPASLTLFAESDQHLAQDSTYALIVTTGVHDSAGNPISASTQFAQFRHDDNFGQTHDRQLKSYRELLLHALDEDNLRAAGVSRSQIAAASVFTTESATATLESIREQVKYAAPPVVNFNLGSNGERTVFPLNSVTGLVWGTDQHPGQPLTPVDLTGAVQLALQLPGTISTIAFGSFSSTQWKNAGVFIPAAPTRSPVPPQGTEELFFNLFIPAGPRPSSGWPVAIFGHGFTDSKQGAPLLVAATLAHFGIATIAINVVGHGFGPDSTLTVSQGTTSTTFPEGGRGVDQDGNGVITSAEGSSTFVLSPQGTIGSRDALQQTTADLMQLVRAIQGGIDADGDSLPDLDANRIYYAGQSFGGIYGTIFLGIEPDVKAGVPNVPGGSIIDIVRLSPGFQLLLTQALAVRVPSLLNAIKSPFFNDNSPLRNLPPVINNVPGAIAIQTVEDSSRWLGQAGDPVAWAPFIRKSPLGPDMPKSVIVQFARGDETVPNPTATALIRSGDLKDRATFFRNDLAFPTDPGDPKTNPGGFPKNPHTFLTHIAADAGPFNVAIEAQSQIAVFFESGGALTIDPDGPGSFFEVPIAGPLPEDLGFLP